jgi:hypothetical protein
MTDRTSPPAAPAAHIEELATLVHDAWTANRLSAGWRYGKERNDAERLSPSLVPYDRLPESERELDRIAVRTTLEGLANLGYRIDRAEPISHEESRDELKSQVDRLIARGLPLPAYDLTKRWLAAHPDDDDFRLLNARALRRSGALQRAEAVLDELSGRPDEDGERRGLLAAVNKEMFVRALRRDARAAEHLRRAEQLYREVFDESRDAKYWHGINAATLAFVLGREDEARALAARVWSTCDAVERSGGDDYWWLATKAEAALVQGRFDVAATFYREALSAAGDRIGDVASTRINALLLLDAYGADAPDRGAIEAALRPPAVIVFAGVPIEGSDSLYPRFPAAAADRVRAALAERLEELQAIFGFSGAAAGAELMFVEAMLERRPSVVNVVLPWPREQFAETHVRGAGGEWRRRFAEALGGDGAAARVHHVVSASLGVGIDSPLYERFARQLLTGLASIHASTLGTEAVGLVVADGPPSQDAGSEIFELVKCWESVGIRLPPENVIDLSTFVQRRAARHTVGFARPAPLSVSRPFDLKAILFADVEDYSKIPEDRLPAFIEYFVGGIGARMGLKPYKPDNVRRVGDGLLMVFSSVRDAGLCALELVEWSSSHSQPSADGETYWSRLGLPKTMRIRIALHAGPVFACVDPLTHAPTFEGAHINYAARIEPVTPGNQVYASEAFAALASSWPAPCDEFVCEYVGRTSLAKKAGEYPLYHVRRRA